jgi:hypothetical protein
LRHGLLVLEDECVAVTGSPLQEFALPPHLIPQGFCGLTMIVRDVDGVVSRQGDGITVPVVSFVSATLAIGRPDEMSHDSFVHEGFPYVVKCGRD